MKRFVICAATIQCVNAFVALFCDKTVVSLIISLPIGGAMIWLIADALSSQVIVTRHHGVIKRDERPLSYWILMAIRMFLWGTTIYFPWGAKL